MSDSVIQYKHFEQAFLAGCTAATLNSTEVSLSSIPKEQTLCAHLFVNHEAYSSYCKAYMMHTIRLLQQAKEILSKGELKIQRPNREELLRINNGAYSYEELFVWSRKLFQEVEELGSHVLLKGAPDQVKLRQQLVDMRKHLYQVKADGKVFSKDTIVNFSNSR